MAITKVTGALVDIGDLDLTNVGTLHLDSIVSDASPAVITVGNGINDTTTILGTTKIGTGFGQSPEVGGKLNIGFANSTSHDADNATTGSNSALIVGNYPGVEAANLQAGIQFNIHGGSQNRVAQISAVSQASDDRTTSLVFHTDEGSNRTEKMRITGAGNVGIGVTPDYKLHVFGSDSSASAHGNADDLFIENAGNAGMTIGSGTTSNGSIFFSDSDSTLSGQIEYRHNGDSMMLITGGSNRLHIKGDGDLDLIDGNLIVALGHGIDFSATGDGTGVSLGGELLDDYEYGTWSPGIGEGAVTIDRAHYTKVGRLVHFAVLATGFTNRTSANQVVFNNLPFPVLADHASGGLLSNYNDETNAQIVYTTTNEHIMFYAVNSGGYLTTAHNDLNNSSASMYFFGVYTAV